MKQRALTKSLQKKLDKQLPEFKMNVSQAVSYIKARTCHLEFLRSGDYYQSLHYHLRKSLNGSAFILMDMEPNGLELFIKVGGYSIQEIIEAFDAELSKDSKERGILDADLKQVKFPIKKYRKQ